MDWAGDKGETAKGINDNTEGEKAKRENGETDNHDPSRWTPAHLAERIRAEQVALETRGTSNGERKTITALFADLKGSTALIEGLDPEEARSIIDPALQVMMDAVHRYEGYVAQAWAMASLPYSARRLPMRIIPSERSMPRCACKKRCAAMRIRCARKGILHCCMRVGREYRRSGAALDSQGRFTRGLCSGRAFNES